jgi:predicted chitinase
MTYALTWLPDILLRAGLKVAETPDWRTRGRAEMGVVKGVMCHHTGTTRGGNMPTLDTLINGRSDLVGPLCHLGLGRDGTYYIVAAGRANHAGAGIWEGIATGNSNFIGIEAENSGSDPWPAEQLDAYARGVAAILKQIGASANMVCGHKEYAPGRKVDPDFDMASFRSTVSEFLVGKSPSPPISVQDPNGRATLRRGMRGASVIQLQQQLKLDPSGVFDGGMEAQVRVWQRSHRITPDGIFGPRSWDVLDGQPAQPAVADQPPAALAPAEVPWAIQQIDAPLMTMAFPANTISELQAWLPPLRDACQHYGVDSIRSLSGLFANISVESHSLTQLAESLNYSVQGLINTFRNGRISVADANRLGRKPGEGPLSMDRQRQIADIVYGGDWGRINLGNVQPDDGWTFRGYGPIQVTGRSNCQTFAATIGKAAEDIPAYLRLREGGAMGAAWFWSWFTRDMNLETASVYDLRTVVNADGLDFDTFQTRFNDLVAELQRRQALAGQ